jgi:molecular chaperone HtpG
MTVDALSRRGRGTVHVVLSRRGGFEEILFRALRLTIVTGSRSAVLPFLEKYAAHRSLRVVQLGTVDGDRQVFRGLRRAHDRRQAP